MCGVGEMGVKEAWWLGVELEESVSDLLVMTMCVVFVPNLLAGRAGGAG